MESPVIVENCFNLPTNNNNNAGFPFDESDYDPNDRLQSTLNDIAQRHPEFADSLSFEHFPTWRRKRHGSGSSHRDDREEPQRAPQAQSSRSFDTPDRRFGEHSFPSGFNRFPFSPHFDDFGEDISTEKPPEAPRSQEKRGRKVNPNLPQHLSNTVDLGQKQSPVEEPRGQRSMSAPPENRTCRNSSERDMGGYFSRPNWQQQPSPTPQTNPKERIIPIFVEGRDEPIIPKNVNIETQRAEPNITPTNVQHQQAAPKQQAPPPQQQPSQATPPKEETPPPTQTINKNDPLEKIKSVKSDVLNLMQQVENYTGTRKDKLYTYLDEMLTVNLLKLDDIETEGKDNIRTARKEAIKCIQECISKLEAKAQANEKQNKESTNEDKPPEQPSEPTEVKKSDSKPVFKSTASIELQVPAEPVESQIESSEGIILNTPVSQPMEVEKQTENITDDSKMEVEKSSSQADVLSNVENTSQPATETNK